jgi:hypothetical protein
MLGILDDDNDILPYKVVPSVEGGICLVYKGKEEKLYLECYNDGDIGYIKVEKESGEIMGNEDLIMEEVKEVINKIK